MPAERVVEFVIRDVALDGKPFRSSAWAERMCGVMAALGNDQRMRCSPLVRPVTGNGVRCLFLDARLEEMEPMVYRFSVSFAQDNELQVRDGRIAERTRLAKLQRVGDTA